MLFRPSESSKKIADYYKRYLMTTFGTGIEEYDKQLRKEIDKDGGIADGPYISMSDPYKKGLNLVLASTEFVHTNFSYLLILCNGTSPNPF